MTKCLKSFRSQKKINLLTFEILHSNDFHLNSVLSLLKQSSLLNNHFLHKITFSIQPIHTKHNRTTLITFKNLITKALNILFKITFYQTSVLKPYLWLFIISGLIYSFVPAYVFVLVELFVNLDIPRSPITILLSFLNKFHQIYV